MVFRLTLSDGKTRDFFARNPNRPDKFVSSDGWKALLRDGGKVVVRPSSGDVSSYVFDRGRLVSWTRRGRTENFAPDLPRRAIEGVISPLATLEIDPSYVEQQKRREDDQRWAGTGRLRFPYANPNQSGALAALLFLAALSFVFSPRRSVSAGAAAAAVVLAVLLLWTGSRGAWLGTALGALPIVALHARRLIRQRRFWIAAGATVLALVACFAVFQRDAFSRGFSSHGMDWGNAIRLEMWKISPRMMVDAPSGWGFCGAGRAYVDWYQPPPGNSLTGSLMNDHLTTLVEKGWCGRVGYLAIACLLLVASFWTFASRRRPLPLAYCLAWGAMAWFNPLLEAPGLAFVGLAGLCDLAAFFRNRPVRRVAACAAGSLAAAGLIVGAILLVGSSQRNPGGVSVKAEGPRVLCKTSHPKVWIVDDGQGALGGLFAGQDIREALSRQRGAPSVGYVRKVADLPGDGVNRLVLAGKAAVDWMMLLSENPEARTHLPKSVLLITPPFAPSDIPEGVLKCTKLKVAVGEFAARYQPEYANPPPCVTIVPGMERYVLGWMNLVFGD